MVPQKQQVRLDSGRVKQRRLASRDSMAEGSCGKGQERLQMRFTFRCSSNGAAAYARNRRCRPPHACRPADPPLGLRAPNNVEL